jgi:hypothetical protein
MEYLTWIQNTSSIPEVQEHIEANCESLIGTYFDPTDNYAIEKYLKSYVEKFKYLEELLLHQRRIAPEHIQHRMSELYFVEEYRSKHAEVKRIMLTEASREFRHAITYLSSLQKYVMQKQNAVTSTSL